MSKKIGVIGGSGFVGSYLQDVLCDAQIPFYVIDKLVGASKSTHTIIADVCELSAADLLSETTTLINLAAEHRDDVRPLSRYYDVNVKGAQRVCDVAKLHNVQRIIFTSSVAIYGFAAPDTGEDGEANYFNEYGRTKYLAEEVYRKWQQEDATNRSLVIIRPTVIFGPGNRGNVWNLLRQIASKRFVMFGNGKNKKSMAYVENVADFLRFSTKFGAGIHIYNYIDKPDMDINQLVSVARETLFGRYDVGLRLPLIGAVFIGKVFDILSKVCGRTFSISGIRVKKFSATTQFSSRASEVGYQAPVSLEDGLRKTLVYEFLEDNSDKLTFDTE